MSGVLAVLEEKVEKRIYLIRGKKVMLDSDLAELYGVTTGALIQAVKRNAERFPEDFMYFLTREEFNALISQSVISKTGRGGRTKLPHAFTEQGVAMLSGVLHSKRAVQVNIAIMRTFVKLRQLISTHRELAHKLDQLERRVEKHDHEIHAVFEAIRKLLEPSVRPKRRIGFHP